MLHEPSSSAAADVYPVQYEETVGTIYNTQLRGHGTATFDAASQTWIFSGAKRRMFGGTAEVRVSVDQIVNVRVAGRRVEFDINEGAKARPFLVFCPSAESAQTFAARLPATQTEAFLEAWGFEQKLRALSGEKAWWESPTHLIIAVNVVAFVLMGLAGAGWLKTESLMPYVRYGANNGAATTNGEWWRLVTSMFLHFGVLHLLFNMWALFQAGALMEKLLGRLGFAVAYFGSGIAGSLTSLIWNGDKVWSAGASGAVFGAFGMLGGYILRERHGMPRNVVRPLVRSTLWFAGFNLFYGTVHPHIDNAAHIGGFLCGAVLGVVMALPVDLEKRREVARGRLLAGLSVIVLVVAVGISAAPRFDYVAADEIAWASTLREHGQKEPAIRQRHDEQLDAFRAKADAAGLVRWINEEALPFYTKWESDMAALQLTPGKATVQRRDLLLRAIQGKIRNLRQLAADVAAQREDAVERYQRAELEIFRQTRSPETDTN